MFFRNDFPSGLEIELWPGYRPPPTVFLDSGNLDMGKSSRRRVLAVEEVCSGRQKGGHNLCRGPNACVTWGSRHGQLLKSDFSLKGFPVRKPGSWMWHKKGARRASFFFDSLRLFWGELFFLPVFFFFSFFLFRGVFPVTDACVSIFQGTPENRRIMCPSSHLSCNAGLLVWILSGLADSQTPAYE